MNSILSIRRAFLVRTALSEPPVWLQVVEHPGYARPADIAHPPALHLRGEPCLVAAHPEMAAPALASQKQQVESTVARYSNRSVRPSGLAAMSHVFRDDSYSHSSKLTKGRLSS